MRLGVWAIGMLLLVAGCRSRQSGDSTFLERISNAGRSKVQAPMPGELAEKGRAEISAECETQSYENASKGLIVSETGLHEDVFTLRDRVTYGAIGYGLDEALRLEALLRAEAGAAGQSAEKSRCIQEFAEHLDTLSSPLVEGDERLKELDASAFKDAAREAQEQADKKLREPEKQVDPKANSPEQLPQSY